MTTTASPAAPPSIFLLQPQPISTSLVHIEDGRRCFSAVMRHWGHTERGRCRLCPLAECSLDGHGNCMVGVPERIADDSAALFSLARWRLDHGFPASRAECVGTGSQGA